MPFLDTFKDNLFQITKENFNRRALDLFRYQAEHCAPYQTFVEALGIRIESVEHWRDIPMLPVESFKNHDVKTGHFEPETVYTSSGTTGILPSRHAVKDESFYFKVCGKSFEYAFGKPDEYAWLCLLPSYLERSGSSLIAMCKHFTEKSPHPESHFFLNHREHLIEIIRDLEKRKVPSILLGVSFALLDFAEEFPMPLKYTRIMETGGMKGQREEMVREELHRTLKEAFAAEHILSEYGMTELMSQAYSKGDGVYIPPPWMRVFLRDTSDPLQPARLGKTGGVNVIDLANADSCAFIATQDLGRLHGENTFEILGRFDYSEARGCNLMVQ